MLVFHIPSHISNLFLFSSELVYTDPITPNIYNLSEASDPGIPHILGPFVFLSYVRLYKLFLIWLLLFNETNLYHVSICTLLKLSYSLLLLLYPHSIFSQIREMFYADFRTSE